MLFYNLNQVFFSLHFCRHGRGMYMGRGRRCWCHVIWCGASSISMRKVSMGVSPISLKKKRCSRHLRPMERRAGSRSSSLANLQWRKKSKSSLWSQRNPFGFLVILWLRSSLPLPFLIYLTAEDFYKNNKRISTCS